MKTKILEINNQILDELDMSMLKHINNEEYKTYYNEKSSKEHYRLLTHISNLFDEIKILDVGTLKGCSALALSTNVTNTVYSFNLDSQLELVDIPNNIEFIIDNVINGKYDDLITSCPIILLDTFHDGSFEQEFLNHLINLNYKGVLLLDDIHLNNEMELFWNNIKINKFDITNIGHSTGTGVVFFD
jgi:hypothetical protein